MAARLRVHQSERKAGPSSILSLCCLKRDIHEFAPIVAVLTLSCLAMKTNGCMLRVHPSERYQARSQYCRCVHVMISVCVLRKKLLLMQYCFSEVRWQVGFPVQCESGQNPDVSHPQLQCSQSVFPFQCNLCVLNPIRRSQFNQSHAMQSNGFLLLSWTAGLLPETAKTKDSRARNNAAGFLGLLECCRKQLESTIPALKTMLMGFLWSAGCCRDQL
jgi:hypothetical protein